MFYIIHMKISVRNIINHIMHEKRSVNVVNENIKIKETLSLIPLKILVLILNTVSPSFLPELKQFYKSDFIPRLS